VIGRLMVEKIETSRDGSRKYLYKLSDGKYIESVLIPEKDHYTLCVSSQVGCAQGCRFCLTAAGGFERNLSRGEIIAQVRDIKKDLGDEKRLTNIVFMGMGEPLANYKNLVGAIEVITDSRFGLGFAGRRVTVSTAGLASKLAALGRDTKVNLAISLNASDNDTRNRLMPINRKFPIEKLLKACQHFPLPGGRRITFEYVLLKDVNEKHNGHLTTGIFGTRYMLDVLSREGRAEVAGDMVNLRDFPAVGNWNTIPSSAAIVRSTWCMWREE
jgi:23S rRNA (adenine2503-C2)-methyltransferase